MRTVFLSISYILLVLIMDGAGALRLELNGDIYGDTVINVFSGELLIPEGDKREIFVAPYTVSITAKDLPGDEYGLSMRFAGLGPDYKRFSHEFALSVGEKILIPALPVKNDITINYSAIVVDDTSRILGYGSDYSDTAQWGESASIHYLTRWISGSLADFAWNKKMGYLENIYDQYRYSYKLSMFEKIGITFHPGPSDELYIDPVKYYSILPNSGRINVVYGHSIDAASPALAAELLIYKLWGYGPRWLVTGLSHYYEDNFLILRKFAAGLDPAALRERLAENEWVDSDTGVVFCGAFANWLLTTNSLSNFKNLYRESTPFDYEEKFRVIYDFDFVHALTEFIRYAGNYVPKEGELEYYASIYLRHNDYMSAAEYYEELSGEDGERKEEYLANLAACRFWSGDYRSALDAYDELLKLYGKNPRYMMLKADMKLALGDFDVGEELYEEAFLNDNHGNAGLRLVAYLAEKGKVDSARTVFAKLEGDVLSRFNYSLEGARLGVDGDDIPADTVLVQIANRALANVSIEADDPRGYRVAGKAFTMLADFEKAVENLEIAYFLETRPHFQALTLLELGKVSDLRGKRDEAIEYYNRAAESGGGEFIGSLCRKYLKSKYVMSQ
jgi:tetratricopeptide (TPR) repeat protein